MENPNSEIKLKFLNPKFSPMFDLKLTHENPAKYK